jgi:hypothetical protein
MRAARRFSSRKLAAVLLVLTAAGCAGGANRLLENRSRGELRMATLDMVPAVPAANAVIEQVQVTPAAASPETAEESQAAPIEDAQQSSAWCRYIKEDSAAQANILRSPSLGGSINDEGNASVTVGVSMASFAKAHLVEEAAEAKCRRYLAESGLQKLVFVSPHELTGAGFKAKSEAVSARLAQLQTIRADIGRHLATGNIDAETAAGLGVTINQFVASGSEARSQADRRMGLGADGSLGADMLSRDLLAAESRLYDLDSSMRTADAMDVRLEGGWHDSGAPDSFDPFDSGFTGKVSFSMKLGAFAPSRYSHEDNARRALAQAITGQEGGIVWQTRMLYEAHMKALTGLYGARDELNAALTKSRRLVELIGSAENPDYTATLLRAKVEILRLEADLAGTNGSIGEIRNNMQRLKLG